MERLEPNSYAILTEDLPYDSVSWINNFNDKNLIIVSGDYGAYGQKHFTIVKENSFYCKWD